MSFESKPQDSFENTDLNKEHLKESFGVALCAKLKDGSTAQLSEQIDFVEKMRPSAIQFDFRNRTLEEIQQSKQSLHQLVERNPNMRLSIHGETPKINESDLSIKNLERIAFELNLVDDLKTESFTIHPPSINTKLFQEASEEIREKILENYSTPFVNQIIHTINLGQTLCIAIENMPTKGEEGSFGQTPEELKVLLSSIEARLVESGIDQQTSSEHIGITLDINHALHGVDPEEYEQKLTEWFVQLKNDIKVIHLYTPSEMGNDIENKHNLVLDLAAKYSPDTQLFLESKQNLETTENIYKTIKT
jgi:hypothetical protein